MGKRNVVLNLVVLLGLAGLIVAGTYVFNLWVQTRYPMTWWGLLPLTVLDMVFFEGVGFILLGLLLLVGSGGINRWTVETVFKSSIADWVYGREGDEDRVKPSELFRADTWKPRGFPRVGLTLLLAGVLMGVIYFLSLRS
jgi:hypothetical protein